MLLLRWVNAVVRLDRPLDHALDFLGLSDFKRGRPRPTVRYYALRKLEGDDVTRRDRRGRGLPVRRRVHKDRGRLVLHARY